MAYSLFWTCDLSVWHSATIPVGMCINLTADEVLFTCCPPAPDDLNTSIFISAGLSSISTSSTSGNTATVAVEVCILPLASVSGTLCTLWTPLSNFNLLYAPLPEIINDISLYPPNSVSFSFNTSNFQCFLSAYIEYILYKVPANSAASSPPAPPLISHITFLSSSGSFGISSILSSSSIFGSFSFASSISVSANSFNSGSFIISFASSKFFSTFLYSLYFSTIGSNSECSFIITFHSFCLLITSGSLIFSVKSIYFFSTSSNFWNIFSSP